MQYKNALSNARTIPCYYDAFKAEGIDEYSIFDAVGFEADESEMCATGTLCSSSKDREGEIIEIGGIDTSRHQLNPITLLEHGKLGGAFALPIGITEDRDGRYTVIKTPDELIQTTYFSQSSKEAEQVFSLIAEKILRGWSIGFRRLKGQRLAPDIENGHPTGIYTYACELLEASIVALPCNQDCLNSVVSRGSIGGKALAPAVKSFLMPLCIPNKTWANGIDTGMKEEKAADLPPPSHVQRYESGSVQRQNGEPWGAYQSRLARIHASSGGTPADRGMIGQSNKPKPKPKQGPGPRSEEEKPNRIPAGYPYDEQGNARDPNAYKEMSAIDQTAGGALIGERENKDEGNPRLKPLRQPKPKRGTGDSYFDKIVDVPLGHRLDEIADRDAIARGEHHKPPRPTFIERVHQGIASHPDTRAALDQSRRAVAYHGEAVPEHEQSRRALSHFVSNAHPEHQQKLDRILGEAHHDNAGTLSVGELRETLSRGHFKEPEPEQEEDKGFGDRVQRVVGRVGQEIGNMISPEGGRIGREVAEAPGNYLRGSTVQHFDSAHPEDTEEDKSMVTKEHEDVGENTNEMMRARQYMDDYDQTPKLPKDPRYAGRNDMPEEHRRDLQRENAQHPRANEYRPEHEEEAINERNPRYDEHAQRDRLASDPRGPSYDPQMTEEEQNAPTQEIKKDMEEVKDMPGAAALRKIHGHFGALQSLCGSMKDVEQPKVRAFLDKLSGHAQGHLDGINELFGGLYGDHNPLVCKDDAVREGVPGEDENYEAKDEAYDPNNDPHTRPGSRMVTPTGRPRGEENARHGESHPQGWQMAHGGADEGLQSEYQSEIRNSRGRDRSFANLDQAQSRGKTYQREIEQYQRSIARKARFLGVAV